MIHPNTLERRTRARREQLLPVQGMTLDPGNHFIMYLARLHVQRLRLARQSANVGSGGKRVGTHVDDVPGP